MFFSVKICDYKKDDRLFLKLCAIFLIPLLPLRLEGIRAGAAVCRSKTLVAINSNKKQVLFFQSFHAIDFSCHITPPGAPLHAAVGGGTTHTKG